jgi:hypothetical protein
MATDLMAVFQQKRTALADKKKPTKKPAPKK